VAAQGAATPLLPTAPLELPVLPDPLAGAPLHTVAGATLDPATGTFVAGSHGNPGGTLTGDGTGIATLGPDVPPRLLQFVPSQVHVWS
jgi:hypothetical protein